MAMWPFSTRVKRSRIASVGVPMATVRVMSVVPSAYCRMSLWEAGLDYDHGTGHGVGAFLSVHEGPQRIAKTGTVALKPGMILSNEPEPGRVVRTEHGRIDQPPVDRGQRQGLEAEHRPVAAGDHPRLSPDLDGPTRDWLEAATRPLGEATA
jgi:Xaa-Pro aminopeptidase